VAEVCEQAQRALDFVAEESFISIDSREKETEC
jgi:hypothetical protein